MLRAALVASMLIGLGAVPAFAAPKLSPSTVVVTSRAQSELLEITDDGTPVPLADIGSIQFRAAGKSYAHMMEIERSDGSLLLRPTPELEVGVYELLVTVGYSRLKCRIVATLAGEHAPAPPPPEPVIEDPIAEPQAEAETVQPQTPAQANAMVTSRPSFAHSTPEPKIETASPPTETDTQPRVGTAPQRAATILQPPVEATPQRPAKTIASVESHAPQQTLTSSDVQSIQFDLASWYPVGRIIRFGVSAPPSSRYRWLVNGELLGSGYGASTFEYTLRRPGPIRFEYVEQSSQGETSGAQATTEAREPEPHVLRLSVNHRMRMFGPEGFSDYTWLVDGRAVSKMPNITREFSPGEYRVECIASGNPNEQEIAFEKTVYRVLVQ